MAQLQLSLAREPTLDSPATARPGPGRGPGPGPAPVRAPQLTLPLEQEIGGGIRAVIRLEAALRKELGPKVLVQLTQNRSTMISFKRQRGVLYVRLHAIFADAPEPVVDAVVVYSAGKRLSRRAASLIDAYIDQHRHRVKQPEPDDRIVQPVGETHDLQFILDTLNGRYFDARVKAQITWSIAGRHMRRRSIRMGSYSDDQRLIRIHPALDQDFVPAYFVGAVVFHEMLHELHGVEERADGRRCIHSKAFLSDERRFDEYEQALRWEKRHLAKLLRY